MGLPTTYTAASGGRAAAQNATNAKVNELEARIGLPLVGDNATDNGPILQTQYAAGQREWNLGGNGIPRVYKFSTSAFLNDSDVYDKVFIRGNGGAKITVGTGLYTTDDYSRSTDVKWVFFVNNVDNHVSGKVTMNDAARPTGGATGGLTRLYVENVTFDGGGGRYGLAIGNRTSAHMTGVTHYRCYTLFSAVDYTDSVVFDHCYTRDGSGPTDAAMYHQIAAGDGLEVRGCKADSSVDLLNVSYARGAVISGNVSGRMTFSRSDATISGCHMEAEAVGKAAIVCRNSSLTIDGGVMYARTGSSVPGVVDVDDSVLGATMYPSSVTFTGGKFLRKVDGDLQNGPLISFTSAVVNTKARAVGLESFTIASGETNWISGAGPKLTGPSVMDAALLAGSGLLGYGTWELVRSSNGWKVGIVGNPMASIQRYVTNLTFTPTAPSAGNPGALTDGTTYYYRIAGKNSAGQYTQAAAEQSVAANARRQAKLTVVSLDQPAVIGVWRGTTAGVYDRYVELPASAHTTALFDTGTRVSGEAWATTSIPSVPGSNVTANP